MEQPIRLTRFGFVNAYLVDERDGFTLIDTMLARSAKKILAAAADGGKPIVRIALTHAHRDHVGALDELVGALGDVEVIMSEREARLLAENGALDPDEPQQKLKGSLPRVKSKPTRVLAPGDRVGSLEVLDAKGHSPGQIAFLDTRDRTLICGDAFTTFGSVQSTARPAWPFPLAAMSSWHRPTALQSARALRAIDPLALAPGHGKIVRQPAAAMDAAIARAS